MSDCIWFLLLGVLATWVIGSLLFEWRARTGNYVIEQVLDAFLEAPVIALALIWLIVSFPFIFLWKFFRNAIRGVTIDRWNAVKIPKYWVCGSLRLCYDNRAKALTNKVFLVRLVRPRGIVHLPLLDKREKP